MSKFSDNYRQQLQRQSEHRNVDQVAQSESARRADLKRQYVPGEASPFVEGTGAAIVRTARGVGNLAMRAGGAAAGQPNVGQYDKVPFIGNEAIREQDRLDAPLNEQPGAGLGRFMGEMAMLPGGPARGTASKATSTFARVLGSRAGQRALEGSIASEIYADPSKTTQAGLSGAALSMALGRMGDAAGRLGTGVVKKSDAAQYLEQLAGQHGKDIHIPLSLAADKTDPVSNMVAGTYRNVAPLIPFVGARLEGQRDAARKVVREMGYAEATPSGLNLSPSDLSDSDRALSKINKEFQKQYQDTVKSYAFNVPTDMKTQWEAAIKAKRPNIDKTTLDETTAAMEAIMNRFSDGKGHISGDNLLFARKAFSELIKGSKTHETDAFKTGVEWMDNHIVNELSQGGSPTNLADLRKYLELSEPWKAKVAVEKAAKSSPSGAFGPEQLERASRPGSTTRVLGRTGADVLSDRATRQSLEGKILGGALLGGVGHFMGLGPAAALTAGGHILANKSTQRALTGETALQQAIVNALRKNPQGYELLARTRRGASAELGDEFDGYPPAD